MKPIRMMGDTGANYCLAGGDSYGASLSSSQSSAASQSGATDTGGSYIQGTVFGPGSFIPPQVAGTPGASISTPAIIGLGVVAVLIVFFLFNRR